MQKKSEKIAVILAAGLSSRMKSALPKAMHRLAGFPMLSHLIASASPVFDRIIVVTGPDMPSVEQAARPHLCVIQKERLGTAHAALAALPFLGDDENQIGIFYVDTPLLTGETLQNQLDRLQKGDAALVLLAADFADPQQYGRLITAGPYVEKITEWAEASEEERKITLCNAGAFVGTAGTLRQLLPEIDNHNKKGEFYLTDLVKIARRHQMKTAFSLASAYEACGINSRAELALAEKAVQQKLRARFLAAGVGMTDPDTVYFSADTELAPDVFIEPFCVFGPGVKVGAGTVIRAFSHTEGCDIQENTVIGPYARIRPGSLVEDQAHVGNFVELKATKLGKGAKANHLSYLGDAVIGEAANIGAGTITCNYDGRKKHPTVIGKKAFIGSNSSLIAPLNIGDEAVIGAGSVITRQVSAGALALTRAPQIEKPDYRQQKSDPENQAGDRITIKNKDEK